MSHNFIWSGAVAEWLRRWTWTFQLPTSWLNVIHSSLMAQVQTLPASIQRFLFWLFYHLEHCWVLRDSVMLFMLFRCFSFCPSLYLTLVPLLVLFAPLLRSAAWVEWSGVEWSGVEWSGVETLYCFPNGPTVKFHQTPTLTHSIQHTHHRRAKGHHRNTIQRTPCSLSLLSLQPSDCTVQSKSIVTRHISLSLTHSFIRFEYLCSSSVATDRIELFYLLLLVAMSSLSTPSTSSFSTLWSTFLASNNPSQMSYWRMAEKIAAIGFIIIAVKKMTKLKLDDVIKVRRELSRFHPLVGKETVKDADPNSRESFQTLFNSLSSLALIFLIPLLLLVYSRCFLSSQFDDRQWNIGRCCTNVSNRINATTGIDDSKERRRVW